MPKNEAREAARRRAELAKIHVAKKRLGLDDATYRGIVARVCSGKTSAGDLDEAERSKLLDEFKQRFGFREGNSYTKKLSDFPDREPQMQLIRCQWADLQALGALTDASDGSLMKFIQRTTGIARIEWLGPSDANKAIEGLKAWKARIIGHKQKRSTGA
jgi:hypothetical protein